MIIVKKKNGTCEPWDFKKVVIAVGKSAQRIDKVLTDEEILDLHDSIMLRVGEVADIEVKVIHDIVLAALDELLPEVAEAYRDYRNWHKNRIKELDETYHDSQNILFHGDRENANFNSALISTKGSLIRRLLTTDLYKQHYMSREEKQAMKGGFLYFHDRSDLIFASINCCLFDMGTVLKNGFEMSNVPYQEAKSVEVALQVLTDITVVATAQQFGGFTIPQIDKILIPYYLKSLAAITEEADEFVRPEKREKYIKKQIQKQLKQGFQALEMRLNTVPSSRGDTAFVTITFGNCDDPETNHIQREICEVILNTRMKGQGTGTPVVFPKLVYLYSKAQHEHPDQKKLFRLSLECNSRAMYPDYLSLDAGEVGEIYQRTGKVVSPMGCRAFLSEDDSGVFEGRANIGAVSLNLPMIWQESKGERFWDDLDRYLELTRKFHQKRYVAIADNVCSTNPVAFTQGGLIGGFKKPTDKIGMDIVRHFTASFGITALNEFNVLVEGKPLHESNRRFVNLVVDHIAAKVKQFKEEDGFLYALYGTPAESLAGTQLRQFRDRFGVIEGVSDNEYFSNSFHCHVSADIDPFTKQDMEAELFHKLTGGHIIYCRIWDRKNFEAMEALILRAMEMGFYFGINFDLVVCEDCHHRPDEYTEVCPECGSTRVTAIARICGYLGFRATNGSTRVNDSKLAEMRQRVSM